MSPLQGSPRAWFAAAVLLSLYVYWSLTAVFTLQFEPGFFLPLLTGWLAHRFGHQIVGFLLFVGLLSAITVNANVFDALSIGFGFSEWIYFISVCSAVLFCRPALPHIFDRILNRRWRWLRWLLPVALWVAVFMERKVSFELTDSLQVGANPGFAMLAILMSACVNWKILIDGVSSAVLTAQQKSLNRMRGVILVLLAVAVVVHVEWAYDYWFSLSFGFMDGFGVLLAFAIVVTATGVADWRLTILVLTLFLASEGPVYWLIDAIATAIPSQPVAPDTSGAIADQFVLEEIVVTGVSIRQKMFLFDTINSVSVLLMAAGIAPFLQHRNPDSLNTPRTTIFLILALVVLLVGLPLVHHGIGGFGFFVIGGVAFVVGLRWRIKGIVLAPLIIQLSYLMAIAIFTADYREGPSAMDVVNIGLLAFPFAYFGMLSHRISALAGTQSDNSPVRGGMS